MGKSILSPMPGLVARVVVEEGIEVNRGDLVAVLNVMKTEVDVKSDQNGKVSEIHVQEWDEMETGTPMITLD